MEPITHPLPPTNQIPPLQELIRNALTEEQRQQLPEHLQEDDQAGIEETPK